MIDEARIDVHRGVDHQAIQKATKLIDGPVVCTDNQDTTDAGRPSRGHEPNLCLGCTPSVKPNYVEWGRTREVLRPSFGGRPRSDVTLPISNILFSPKT